MQRRFSWSALWLMAVALPVWAQHTGHANGLVGLRAGPSEEYRRVGEVQPGGTLQVYGCLKSGAWCDVRSPEARGWLPAASIVLAHGALNQVVPKLTFSLDAYWDTHYRGRAWTVESERAYWRDHTPGDSLPLELLAPGEGVTADGVQSLARRAKAETRAETERTQRERAVIDRAALNRIDADRRDDKIHRCERSGSQDDAVQSCISQARSDYEQSVRQRCENSRNQDDALQRCID
ncbi:SH3 domain-containing protein [Xanthomonas euvesicatoria pv. allii]|uniref:SH3 domain-containing protein n=1 Tax=Xanthomonas euvesicatoria TaxID=456327 RepID=UPI0024073539|nr:SH3 domain-containing protein [Xanthomonas euvesicatoria]MCP3046462.1 SH3 domain-containing protein [Xanthomonas euvesicatoria pv. allii]